MGDEYIPQARLLSGMLIHWYSQFRFFALELQGAIQLGPRFFPRPIVQHLQPTKLRSCRLAVLLLTERLTFCLHTIVDGALHPSCLVKDTACATG